MAEWNLIEMLANFMGNAPNEASKREHDDFVRRGYLGSAQASPMGVRQPTIPDSNLLRPEYSDESPNPFPMTGRALEGPDTIGHGVPRGSAGRGEDFMRALKRGLGGHAPSLPAAGERQQMFADIPRPGYDPTQRRY